MENNTTKNVIAITPQTNKIKINQNGINTNAQDQYTHPVIFNETDDISNIINAATTISHLI